MRMVLHRRLVRAAMVVACLMVAAAGVYTGIRPAAAAPVAASPVRRLDHVFLIVEENNGFHDVIGNPAAPNLNYLARTFGLETDYYGLSTNASEINYVGLLGGSTYGAHSDDAYWTQRVSQASLITQLDRARIGGRPTSRACPTPVTRASATRPNATGHRTPIRCMCPSTTRSRTSRPRSPRGTGRGRCRSDRWAAT
jgi:hypothetical protein